LALTREKKEQIVEDLSRRLTASQVVILTDYRGLTVPQLQDLRNRLRKSGGEYRVVKNTLTRIALRRSGKPVPEEMLFGPTALLFLYNDIAQPTKTLMEFAEETKILTIKGGLLGDQILEEAEVKRLADLPSRDTILAELLNVIQGPAANIVHILEAPANELLRTLQAPLIELVMTIQAYADQRQQAA